MTLLLHIEKVELSSSDLKVKGKKEKILLFSIRTIHRAMLSKHLYKIDHYTIYNWSELFIFISTGKRNIYASIKSDLWFSSNNDEKCKADLQHKGINCSRTSRLM